MKKLISLALLLLTTTAFATTELLPLPAINIFVPFGFDANDNAEVVVTGYLPNPCYKAPQTRVSIVNDSISIELKTIYTIDANTYCLGIIVPFTEVISLGVLDKGTYKISVNAQEKMLANKGLTATLKIAETSSDAIDNFIYASVENIIVENGDIILKGYNPSNCTELKGIKIVNNGVDAYSVLPQMRKVSDFCPMKPTPFEYRTKLPTVLKENYVLLHVRAMDGKSLNRVISTKYDY